jgi:hypothetical protein
MILHRIQTVFERFRGVGSGAFIRRVFGAAIIGVDGHCCDKTVLPHQMVENRAIERAVKHNAGTKSFHTANLRRQSVKIANPDGDVLSWIQLRPIIGETTAV